MVPNVQIKHVKKLPVLKKYTFYKPFKLLYLNIKLHFGAEFIQVI